MNTTGKIPLGELREALPKFIDLFVCSASYETRSKVAPLALPSNVAKQVLVCCNEDVQGAGKAYAEELVVHFGERAKCVWLSKTNPVRIGDALMMAIKEAVDEESPVTCAVDITTFTHEALLILLRILQVFLPPGSEVIHVYTPAKEYDPNTPLEDKWLSRGLGSVRSVLGYPGNWLPSQKIHLIVLVGFESNRVRKLIEAYEPDALSLGVGCINPINATLEETRKIFYQQIAEAYPNYDDFEFSPRESLAVKDVLLTQIGRFIDHNTVIAPMNTKISTIGAAMAAFERDQVQLTYGSAGIYNTKNYSIPDDFCIVFSIPSFPAPSL